MKNQKYTLLENAFSVADAHSFAEVQAGVFVQTKESLISEQKGWPDEDESKDADFSAYAYWLVVDSGEPPEGIKDIKDLVAMLKN